ncbi:MAG: nitronate monooxygenase [Sphingomonadales bacterium]
MLTSLHRPVCDLLGCEYPIVLAGMGGVARSELVCAVTDGGGFGFLGMVREPPELIEREVARVRDHTAQPFGVNLIPAATDDALLERQLATCVRLRVPVICLFWDLAGSVVRRLREEGITVVCQVGSSQDAAAAERAGAQILIAQGIEAGGHVRGNQSLERLVTDIVTSTDLPVLAAGGLANGGDLVTMLALGAQGAVFGTAMIATHESFAHDYHKTRILEAGEGDTVLGTDFHVNWPKGARVRTLRNSVTSGSRGNPHSGKRTVIGYEEDRPIYLFSTDSPLLSMTGDFEAMALYAGTGVGRIVRIMGAADRVRIFADQAQKMMQSKTVPPPPNGQYASPACAAHEMKGMYMGYASKGELLEFLNELLEAERAGARLTRRTADESIRPDMKELVLSIHRDEARWCAVLASAIVDLGGTPSRKTGAFLEKAMAIGDINERLNFLIRGQEWVVKKLRHQLPRVLDGSLHGQLREMLDSHDSNTQRLRHRQEQTKTLLQND